MFMKSLSLILIIFFVMPFVAGYTDSDCSSIEKYHLFEGEEGFISWVDDASIIFNSDGANNWRVIQGSTRFNGIKEGDHVTLDGLDFEISEINLMEEYYIVNYDEESYVVPFYNKNHNTGGYKEYNTGDYYFTNAWEDLEMTSMILDIQRINEKNKKNIVLGETFDFLGTQMVLVEVTNDGVRKGIIIVRPSAVVSYCYAVCSETKCEIKKEEVPDVQIIPRSEYEEVTAAGLFVMKTKQKLVCGDSEIVFEGGPTNINNEPAREASLISTKNGKVEAVRQYKYENTGTADPVVSMNRKMARLSEYFSCNGALLNVVAVDFENTKITLQAAMPEQKKIEEEPVVEEEIVEELAEPEVNVQEEPKTEEPVQSPEPQQKETKGFFEAIAEFFRNLFS